MKDIDWTKPVATEVGSKDAKVGVPVVAVIIGDVYVLCDPKTGEFINPSGTKPTYSTYGTRVVNK